MKRAFLICVIALAGLIGLYAQQAYFAKDPVINPEGSQVCFVYDSDLWIVAFEGGDARRLTSTPGGEWGPQWSPDGQSIAFNSIREGLSFPYLMPAAGGAAKPIIRESYSIIQWYPDGKALLAARYNQRYGISLFRLPIDGSRPELIAGIGDSFATISPDMKSIIFNRYGDPHREAYQGSLAGQLWKIDLDSKQYTQLTFGGYSKRYPRFAPSSGALFYCESDGKCFQLKRAENLNFGEAQTLSEFTDWSARDISVAGLNERIVFELFDQIYKYDPAAEKEARISPLGIRIAEDQFTDTRRFEISKNDIWQYAVSSDEKFLGLQYKYDAFIRPRAGGEPKRVTFDQTGILGMEFLEDSRNMLLLKMDQGKKKMYKVNVESPTQMEEIDWFGRDSLSVEGFYLTPSGIWVVHYSTPRLGGQIAIADSGFVNIRSINVPQPVLGYIGINDDASWAVYSSIRTDFVREHFLYEFATGEHTKLMNDLGWSSGYLWTPDNRSILFSQGGGIYRLDLVPRDEFELDKDYWAEALKAKEEKAAPEEEKAETGEEGEIAPLEEGEEDIEEAEDAIDEIAPPEQEASQKEPKKLEIYWPDLQKRVYQILAASDGMPGPVRMKSDSTFYFLTDGYFYDKETTLKSVNIFGQNVKDEGSFGRKGWGFRLVGDTYYYVLEGILRSQPIGGGRKDIPLSFEYEWDESMLNLRVFEEAWGEFGERFYDPNMHGRDWQTMYELFLPYAQKARNIQDIGNIVDEMIGDLNASHTGFYPRSDVEGRYRSLAYLGLDFDQSKVLERGVMVAYVYPGTRLSQLFKLQAGDLLTHIDGVEITPNSSLDLLLADKIGKRIYLWLERDGELIEADIKGMNGSQMRKLVYTDKIERRRKLVDEISGGKLGYIHIPAMGQTDYETFTQELYRDNMDKEGLIIDVRGNVGGRIHDQLISILIKKQYAQSTSRRWQYTPTPEPYRVWDRPSIVLVDEHSFSDGEIFPIVYKELKLGKVVGYPSSGAVIGTTEYQLIDGSTMRMPGSGWYKMDGTNMEGSGAEPDIIVENTPNDIIEGRDPQLLRAIEEIMQEIR